jgi:tetratricopeptide (TPR) repeat protein
VRQTGYLPLLAETLPAASLLSNDCASLAQALAWLSEGYVVGVEAHDDEAAAESATLESGFYTVRGHRPQDGRLWLEIARASLTRIEARPLLQSWWLMAEGSLLLDEGRPADAVKAYQSSLDIKKKLLGEDHLDVVRSMNNLGQGLQAAGRLDEALASFTAAANAAQRILGPEHPFVGQPWNNAGEVLNLLGRYAEARAAFERSIAILQRKDIDPEIVAYPLTGLGLAELGEGQPEKAIAPLEQALKTRTSLAVAREQQGEVRFALARALWSRQADRARATGLAKAARDDYAQGGTNAKLVEAIGAWLKAPTARR